MFSFGGKEGATRPLANVLSQTHLYRYADGRVFTLFIGGDDQQQGVADNEHYQRDPDEVGAPLVLSHHVGGAPNSPSCTQFHEGASLKFQKTLRGTRHIGEENSLHQVGPYTIRRVAKYLTLQASSTDAPTCTR